ncbi:16S rRNA (guanine(966)-N(2))-methyltransferase RsmD [Clostridium aminobutyricum]|uniref:16S rRNA (Guanine(966)-N(2))-methyltransferase RsmD n=1 Tax=Clostridium aminobutyricum TaxID=33953 RepID=A0A939D6S7_CLOAM|nr:16S rRNA (guanine(966)-N(2))-methyltransferase RsmD [Clostridium aminobutyricum]MBN7772569.1 16S rRNA (guanine(966)-N(2))-methyltransferase RsmD [Clostridium aminobutyricum]
MRIIAGDLKGRKLISPKDDKVRPTSDKVKEAIFSMIADTYYDEVVIDLFAGTGNLGIEAISRGAKRCYFGDRSRESLVLIKENITKCNVQDQSVIIAGDYEMILKRISEKAQIIFLDPPYKDGLMIGCIELIDQLDLLKEDGYIIAEHSLTENLPEQIGHFEKIKEKKYGKIVVSIYG